MTFEKGYDPDRNTDQTYRPGDGKKRGLFVKGYDPRRLPNERLQQVNFKKGSNGAQFRDAPRVSVHADAALIPAQYQVEVSPALTGRELLPMLTDAITFGERMMEMIIAGPKVVLKEEVLGDEEETEPPETQEDVTRKHLASRANVENALAVGLYTVLIDKCIKTRAEIEGGGLKPAMFGKLGEEAVDQIKEELAFLLHCNITKLNHGLHYANSHSIFDKAGRVEPWADKSMRALLSAIRTTIETRARLDGWENKKDRAGDAIDAAWKDLMNG